MAKGSTFKELQVLYSWLTKDMWANWLRSGYLDYEQVGRDGVYSVKDWTAGSGLTRYLDWYNSYLQSISPYQGTEYYSRLMNNPYLAYQHGLGDTEWRERQNSAELEKYNIIGDAEENARNSTVAAAARDRQAGFNPALTGQLAGNQAAADTTPSDSQPTAGVSPDAQLQADILERQNSFDRAFKLASLPLDLISSVSSGMTAFSGLMKVGAEVGGLIASAGASDAAAALSMEQAVGQKAQNQNAWRGQFLDTIMGGVDLAKGSANIADRIKSVDKSVMTPEQAEYFDSLVNSGYFADADGNASAAAMQDYSARLAGTSGNMFDAGLNVGRLGGISNLDDPSSAMSYIMGVFGQNELDSLRLDLDSKRLNNDLVAAQTDLVSLQQLKTSQETANLEQEGINLVTENEKLTAEAATAELDRKIRAREEEIQGLMTAIQKNDLRREKLRSDSYNRILDIAEKSNNGILKYNVSRFIQTLDDANVSYQRQVGQRADLLGKVVGLSKSF